MERTDDYRGNAHDRFERKSWLLGLKYSDKYGWAPYGGDGEHVACVHCETRLTRDELEADRIIPNSQGGRYHYSNCQPSCEHCNASRGDKADPNALRWDAGQRVNGKGEPVAKGGKLVGQGWWRPDGEFIPVMRGARVLVAA